MHKKIAEQVAEAIKDKQMAEWVAKALPPLWGSSDVDLEEIKYVQVRDAMKNMKNWNPGDLWKGAVPSAVVELLRKFSMGKTAARKLAQKIAGMTEQAAVDIWILTNEHRHNKAPHPEIVIPRPDTTQRAQALATMGRLGRTIQQFEVLHPAHQVNVVAKAMRVAHGAKYCEVPPVPIGAALREVTEHGDTKNYRVTALSGENEFEEAAYVVTADSTLDGAFYANPEEASKWEVKHGLTDEDRGRVHKALYVRATKRKKTKSKNKGNKGVAACITQVQWDEAENELKCTMLTSEGKAETKGVKQVLAQYTMKGPMRSKARNRHSARGRRRPLAILGCSDEEEEHKGKHRRGAAQGRTIPPITSGGDAGGGSPRRGKDKRGPGDDGGSGGGGGDDDGDATSSGNGHPARWVVPKEGHEK